MPKIMKAGHELTSESVIAEVLINNGIMKDNEEVRQTQEASRQSNTTTAIGNAETATENANSAATLANTKAGLADAATTNANNATTIFTQETIKIYKPAVATYADIATTYPTPANGWDTIALDTSIEWRYNITILDWVNLGVKSDVNTATNTNLGTIKGGGNVEIALDGTASVPDVGDLLTLTTEDKTSIVNALNEINAKPSVSTAEEVTYGVDSNVKVALDNIINPVFEDYSVTTPIPTPEDALPLMVSGESQSILFSKIKAFLMGAVTLAKIANNLVTTVGGYVLDARQGKVLQDQVTTINDNLGVITVASGTVSVANNTNTSLCSITLQAGAYFITANVSAKTTVLCEKSARIRQGDETYIAIQSTYINEWSTSNVNVPVIIPSATVFHCVVFHKAGVAVECDGSISAMKIK